MISYARCCPLAFIALLLVVGPAAADDDTNEKADDEAAMKAARELFDDGIKHMDRRDYQGAIDRFERAYQGYSNAKILFNIAFALKELGRNVEAANAYQRYLDHPDAAPARVAEIRPILASLDAALGTLVIQIDDTAALVQINDSDWRPAAEARRIRVTPGTFVVRARSDPGSREQGGQIAAGEVRDIQIELIQRPKVQAPQPSPVQIKAPADSSASRDWTTLTPRRWIAIGAAGAGLISIGTGVYFREQVFDSTERVRTLCPESCSGDAFDDANEAASAARRERLISVIGFGVGTAAIAGSVALWMLGSPERAEPTVVPIAGADTVGLAVLGRF